MRVLPRSVVRHASHVAGAGLVAHVTAQPLGCSSDPAADSSPAPTSEPDADPSGSVGMLLTLAGGEVLGSASWVITGPNGASTVVQQGPVDVQNSQSLSFTISGIAAGSGYTVSVSGTTTDGTVTCAGFAMFSVSARQTTSVTVLLRCGVAVPDAGSLSVGSQVYSCAAVSGVSANPSETPGGTTLVLAGSAVGPNPAALVYAWSAPSGSFSTPNASSTGFTCTAAGPVTATLTVSDGAVPDASSCSAQLSAATIQVQCDAAGDAGAFDAGGAETGPVDSGAEAASDAQSNDSSLLSDAQGNDGSLASDAQSGDAGLASDAQGNDAGPGDAGTTDSGTTVQDVVVYRVGDGMAGLAATGAAVFVDEFDPTTGLRVKSTAMPTVASGSNHRLIASGTATSEGMITTSVDGRYVVLTGYDSPMPFTAADGGGLGRGQHDPVRRRPA